MDGWMDGWTDGRTDGRVGGWMDGWILGLLTTGLHYTLCVKSNGVILMNNRFGRKMWTCAVVTYFCYHLTVYLSRLRNTRKDIRQYIMKTSCLKSYKAFDNLYRLKARKAQREETSVSRQRLCKQLVSAVTHNQ
jgi:hypothetical protein